jgi:hypothetical protein
VRVIMMSLGPRFSKLWSVIGPMLSVSRLVLAVDAGDAGVALGLLRLSVDHPVL